MRSGKLRSVGLQRFAVPSEAFVHVRGDFRLPAVLQNDDVVVLGIIPGKFEDMHLDSPFGACHAGNDLKIESFFLQEQLLGHVPVAIVAQQQAKDLIIPAQDLDVVGRRGIGVAAHVGVVLVLAVDVAEDFVGAAVELFIADAAKPLRLGVSGYLHCKRGLKL